MLAHLIAPALARRGVHYGWLIVAATFMTTLCTGAVLGLPGVLMNPLHDEFGWSVSTLSAPLSLRLVLFGLTAPFAAALIARYGIRLVVCGSLACIVVGLGLSSMMTTQWQLWAAWGVLLGIAPGMTALVLGATIANRWFVKRRGLVLGLLTASNATGQLAFMPLVAWLATHYGWRSALVPGAIACVVCFLFVLLVVRDHPSDVGLPALGETAVTMAPPHRGNALAMSFSALAEASRSRSFWILFGTFAVCGLSTSGLVQTFFIPLCHDYGIETVAAAGVLTIMGMCDFIGTISSGWLSDRVDNRWLLFWYYGLRGLSLMALPYTGFSMVGLSIFGIFYGLDWIATVPPTIKLAAANFGREKAALIFGWIFTGHQLGGAVAALGAGISRDALSSYLPAFFAAGVMCLVAAAAVMWIRTAPGGSPGAARKLRAVPA